MDFIGFIIHKYPIFRHMNGLQLKTYFEALLSDEVFIDNPLTLDQANSIFIFFKEHWLFKWHDAHNDCEDRANAICILLDQWRIPNYKAWVFSGQFLKGEQGTLTNLWNYHVATAIPVLIDNIIYFYVIDPATSQQINSIDVWADNVTEAPYSYNVIKQGNYYIFAADNIQHSNWYLRNQENYRWTIEGLAGINGVAPDGEQFINENKLLIEKTRIEFNKLKNGKSPFKL